MDEIVDFSPKEIATCKDEKHGQFLRKATKTRFNATFHHLSTFFLKQSFHPVINLFNYIIVNTSYQNEHMETEPLDPAIRPLVDS